MGNVNLVVLGEGYGISSGLKMYNNTFEKIDHDTKYFKPVRLGFWYWNTFNNKLINTKLIGISEEEMNPYFYGGTGYMEITY
jgi:hypothetical protein